MERPFPKPTVIVIGAGRFGTRAVKVLRERSVSPILLVDCNEERLTRLKEHVVEKVLSDGISFLTKNSHLLNSANTIVPAVPFHLAFEWLKNVLNISRHIEMIQVPKGVGASLPHTWAGADGSLLISYADFLCPVDCPEPTDLCTITGKKRKAPLYRMLRTFSEPGYRTATLRSRQLAPGLGGYRAGDLDDLLSRITEGGDGKWLVGTACKCHGILTAMEMHKK